MRKIYSIGLLVITLLLIVGFSFAFRMSYQRMRDESEKELEARTQGDVGNYYYIKEKDGYVIVYEGDEKTVYEYTTIHVEDLPEQTQKALKKGIKVNSLSQIYGFLENYSS